MKRNAKKYLILGIVFILVIASIPVAVGKTASYESNFSGEKNEKYDGTYHYSNCLILLNGNCNVVSGPLVWIFDIYCPLLKRSFNILANNGENESLNVFVFGQGLQLGSFTGQEHIFIDINSARGFLHWTGKATSAPGNKITLFCRANDVLITTYD